jgi:hypothetical protein
VKNDMDYKDKKKDDLTVIVKRSRGDQEIIKSR